VGDAALYTSGRALADGMYPHYSFSTLSASHAAL